MQARLILAAMAATTAGSDGLSRAATGLTVRAAVLVLRLATLPRPTCTRTAGRVVRRSRSTKEPLSTRVIRFKEKEI